MLLEQSSRAKERLKEQFVTFSQFGDRNSDGKHITLSRSDKWLKQAGVVDDEFVTTTDTAILFRKMSRQGF